MSKFLALRKVKVSEVLKLAKAKKEYWINWYKDEEHKYKHNYAHAKALAKSTGIIRTTLAYYFKSICINYDELYKKYYEHKLCEIDWHSEMFWMHAKSEYHQEELDKIIDLAEFEEDSSEFMFITDETYGLIS